MHRPIVLKIFCTIVFVVYIGSSCERNSSKPSSETVTKGNSQLQTKSVIHFISPVENETLKAGTKLNLQVEVTDTLKGLDSIQYLIDGTNLGSVKNSGVLFPISTDNIKMGENYVQAIAFFKENRKEYTTAGLKIVASAPPALYRYNIINTYPHDKKAFTQGLIYEDGYLFEGTGEYGESTLRKVNLTTGKMVLTYYLPSEVFGEGVTSFDDKLIQITWKERTAFIFDKATFKLINKLKYSMKEGWGITYDGKNLIMSDGSAYLYFLNKDDLTQIGQIEVCDDQGPVEKLNELEFIDGEVWANVWYSDYILRINPRNGEVKGKIDLSGLIKPYDKNQNADVLNGIAFDQKSKRIWVTGKNWPKLFEISVYQK